MLLVALRGFSEPRHAGLMLPVTPCLSHTGLMLHFVVHVRLWPRTACRITRDQLASALQGALSASPFFARWVLPLVLEKVGLLPSSTVVTKHGWSLTLVRR